MATYCAVTDLQKYVSQIDGYDLKVDLPDFEFASLGSDVFSLGNAGSCIVMYQNGVDLGAAAANVGAVTTALDWFYDSATDLLTIKLASGDTPSDADIRLQRSPIDWPAAKTRAIQIGSDKFDQYFDGRYPRPIPKVQDSGTGDEYDQAVIELSALEGCLYLIQSSGAGENDWRPVKDRITNEEENGILDLLRKGEIKLSFELTASDQGSLEEISVNVSSSGYPTDVVGESTTPYEVFTIKIGTGGTFTTGTANSTITYSTTDLAGNTVQSTTLIDGEFQAMGGGMSARFVSSTAGLVYTANDKWKLVVQTKGVETSVIRTIRMTRR